MLNILYPTKNVCYFMWAFCGPLLSSWFALVCFKLLYGMVTPRPDVPDKTMPDGARQKKLLVLSGILDQKFVGNFKEVDQIVPDSTRISLCLHKRHNLVLSGTIWPTSFKFPANFWCRKPDRTSHFLVWLRLGRFCLACLVLV